MGVDDDGDGGRETKKFIGVWVTVVASVCYCYFVAGSLPKGKLRLLSLLPVFSLFAVLPFSLSTILPTGVTAFFVTWLASFKLLLFAFDRGPLSAASSSHPPHHSLFYFVLLACFPVKIIQNREQDRRSSENPKLPLNLPSKLLLLGLTLLVHEHRHSLLNHHPTLILAFYSCMLYLFVDLIVGTSNFIVRPVLSVELDGPSDEPYLSTSLQDFWGRRWNLTVTNSLRHTVYLPIKSFLRPYVGGASWVAAMVAVLAAFLVSGLMHELLFYQMTRVGPTWEVTRFFVLQGVCVVAEVRIKGATERKGWKRLPVGVSTPMTLGFVVATAAWLFYPPLTRSGADLRAIGECKALIGVALKLGRAASGLSSR